MENDKPTYEEIEQELNEYKDLLWQLSDEYKENLGNAEKKLEEEIAKYKKLEQSVGTPTYETVSDYISLLGMPACILDNEGNILRHNNKFKFLIELLGFEIEEVPSISAIFRRNLTEGLPERFDKYLKGDDGILQSIFKSENQLQGIINLVLRVYRSENEQEHLVLLIELNQKEISNLCTSTPTKPETFKPEKDIHQENIDNVELQQLKTEIVVFTEKYELFEEISKSPEFSSDKNEISSTLLQAVRRNFNLEILRNRILEKLQMMFKIFIYQINKKYPDLTNNEEKHSMLIKAGLTYKEIAAIMDVSINGVKIARNRLRKKFDLENETKTSDFIDKII